MKLFTPVQIGPYLLKHRVVMAPLTRNRSQQPGDIPGDMMLEYYSQRASDGGYIISEATTISVTARGWYGAPGMYTDQQVEGWKKIVQAVHAKGSRMFSQLWHTGRASHIAMTGGEMPVSASVNPSYLEDTSHLVSIPTGWTQPSPHRALDIAEIPGIVEDYRRAAERAMAAGFDGVARGQRLSAGSISARQQQPSYGRLRRFHRKPLALSARSRGSNGIGLGRGPGGGAHGAERNLERHG
jgi:N-ethylmaleimide reductase